MAIERRALRAGARGSPRAPRRPVAACVPALLAGVLAASCSSANPYAGVEEPLYRGRPTAYWIDQLRYDLPRGFETDVVPAIAHLAPVDERAASVLANLLVDRDGEVRRSAFAALEGVDPAFASDYQAELVAGLQDPDPRAAAQALQSLVGLRRRGAELPDLGAAIRGLSRRPDLEWAQVVDRQARSLVDGDAIGGGDPELGLLLAECTLRLASRPEPDYVETLAWAHYRSGDIERAIALARQAVTEGAHLPSEQRARYDATLRYFLGE